MANRHILIVGAGADPSRVRVLAEHVVARGIDVVVPRATGQLSFDESFEAAGIVLAFGGEGPPQELRYPLDNDARIGRLIAVRLQAGAALQPGMSPGTIDLTTWSGGDSPELNRLVGYLWALVEHRLSRQAPYSFDDSWVLSAARDGVTGLAELTAQVGDLVEVLADDAVHTRQLRLALSEVGATYRVVKAALERFVAAGIDPKRVDGDAFARLERGVLAQAIANGRGHCGRITTQYEKVGGLRDAIVHRIPGKLLKKMDSTFERLGTADGDLFAAMDNLGEALTGESRIIVRHLITGREDLARRRISEARDRLLTVEKDLDDALVAFQAIENSLGYAEPTPQEREIISMSIRTIHIEGDVINSNVVAAEVIENSSVAVTGSSIDSELKSTLLDLHKAVASLTTLLPDDQAERAAQDLKELSEEAKKPNPRPAFWQRAAEGLMEAAKKAAEVGGPVIELVTKVVALL